MKHETKHKKEIKEEVEKSPKKILIVDDEASLGNVLATALSYEGYITLKATDGEAGLVLAEKELPDLIILDIMMPKVDGITMLKRLRENEATKKLKVIVMTALDDMSKIAEVLEVGGDEYIVKSKVSLDTIIAKVKGRLGDG
jgi:DNA-binding response OmpR family regulator